MSSANAPVSSPTALPRSPVEHVPASRRPWLAVLSVTLGIFTVVTTEILPVGLLTSIGGDFTVSDGVAGLTMTMPGLLAALSAPLVTAATARCDRRRVLCAFVLLLAVANFLAASASHYALVLVSRVLVGVVIGGFWSIGAGIAERLVPRDAVGRATAVIFSAVPLGSVLGVPAGTFVGELAGWRTAFALMGVLSLGVVVAMSFALPPLPSVRPTRLGVLRGLMRRAGTRRALLLTFLAVLAHFGAYTYVAPFLEQVTGAKPELVTLLLLLHGAAGVVGNFLGGTFAARRPRAASVGAGALIAAAALLLPVVGGAVCGALVLLVVWGVAYGAVPVLSQTWFAHSVPDLPEAASVLFTTSFQATFACGALAGGVVVDAASPSAVMPAGGAVALLMALAALRRMPGGAPAPRSPRSASTRRTSGN